MSANNIVFIRRKDNAVFYQGCVDNEGLGQLQGKFRTIDEAIDNAQKLVEKFQVEYGISFC